MARINVNVVLVDAVPLFTIRLSRDSWFTPPPGSIVRVVFTDGYEQDRVELVRKLKESGASHVWFAPREGKRQAVPKDEQPAPAAPANVREVVAGLVERANTRDRDRLRAVVSAALDRSGA